MSAIPDRELKHMWRQYLSTVEEASRIAKRLGLSDSTKLDDFANVARYNLDVISKRLEKDNPAYDSIKNIIGQG